MEIKETIEETIKREVIKQVLCNVCGKDVMRHQHVIQGTKLLFDFGYGSAFDGRLEEAHICDKCYEDWIGTFKHPPSEV